MTRVFCEAGLDVIKDDHGWAADARVSFRERVVACQREIEAAGRARPTRTLYAPAVSGNLDVVREQIRFAQAHGVGMVLVTPMILGVSNLHALRREFPTMALLAHPALAGNQIAPPALAGNAVPTVRGGCGDLPQPRRTLQLHAADLCRDRRAAARSGAWPEGAPCRCRQAACRSSGFPNWSTSTASTRCC